MDALWPVVALLGVVLTFLVAAFFAGRATLDDRVSRLEAERDVAMAEVELARAQGARVRDAAELVLEAERLRSRAAGRADPRERWVLLSGAGAPAPAGGEAAGHESGDPSMVGGQNEVAAPSGGPGEPAGS